MPVRKWEPYEDISRGISVFDGGSGLANRDHLVKTPLTTARRLSVRTGDVHAYRTSEINVDMKPTIRAQSDVIKPQTKVTRPQVKTKQAHRAQILSMFPRLAHARYAIKRNLKTLSEKL